MINVTEIGANQLCPRFSYSATLSLTDSREIGRLSPAERVGFGVARTWAIERTLFTLEWIKSPELRRRVHLGLNKGEARNSLARAIFFYRHGAVRDRLREDLQNKASGLNLV